MKSFIYTGYHSPTATTCDDPRLKVIEIDNGLTWSMKFYVDGDLIDVIDLENPKGQPISQSIHSLPVYDENDVFLGTVLERGMNAISVYLPEPLDHIFE